MIRFTVQENRCDGCGLCVLDCPAGIIAQSGGKGDGVEKGTVPICAQHPSGRSGKWGLSPFPPPSTPHVAPEDEKKCFQCRHCLAVCPTAAISVFGVNPDDSLPVSPDVWPRFEQMTHLLRGRRSVRQYHDRNVDPALIDRLLATVANAPTGVNSRLLTFRAIDDREQMQRLREKVMQALVEAARTGRIPPRLTHFHNAISAYVDRGADVIFRGAPHALIISARPQAPCAAEDVTIALAYFELLAQTAGLGTLWCGFLKLAFETLPELKSLVALPPDHHYYPMLFGPPAVRYVRTVQRDDAASIRRVKVRN
jgi:Fe-S-cluster-containing hydrogenase component 2